MVYGIHWNIVHQSLVQSCICHVAAPAGDLTFLKELLSYPDSDIAKATSKTFANHLHGS